MEREFCFKSILTESALFSPETVNDLILTNFFFRLRRFAGFYRAALTRYQLHSPFVFEWAVSVLDDRRWYYPFRDIEALRAKMKASPTVIELEDYGARGPGHRKERLARIVARTAVSPAKGRMLFRTVNWLRPATILELGASSGISTMYLASAAAQSARVASLEGSIALTQVAEVNLTVLRLGNVQLYGGPFDQMLEPALQALGAPLDLVFFDGDHRGDATLRYFETCLARAHDRSVFVFDDLYWSADMAEAWARIKQHPKVTLTLDTFHLGFVFINPDFKEKQHLRVVPARWKPWKVF